MVKQLGICLLVFFALATGLRAQIPVFVNEIHYDDVGTDTLEGIEIAGPAGTNLSCFRLYLYNGANPQSVTVYDSILLSGVLTDQCNGFGFAFFPFPNLQNGSNDGFALVFNPTFPGCGLVGPPTLVQFLSYEGVMTDTFLGSGRLTAGLTSTDIGVGENSGTLDGQSMQLTGNGTFYGDFTWTNNTANTNGNVNNGQSFGGPCGAGAPVATEVRFTATPVGCITPGQNFSISVCGTDSVGNVDLTYASNITLSLISGPGVLSGVATQPAILGCANFPGLALTLPGTYQFRASDGTFSDTSAFVYISTTCTTCPNLNAALIDACGIEEGRNEILFYSSGDYAIPVTPAAINVTYGASTPPATCYTNSLVSNQAYVDSLNAIAGCGTLFIDALSNSPIPPQTQFLIMNYQPLTYYNFAGWCSIGPIYLVFSDDPDWNQFTGNFKNHLDCLPGENGLNPRFFRSDFTGLSGGATCDFTHSYIPCTDLLGLGNGDGLDFGYGGGTPTAAWNECTPTGVLAVQYGLELQARRVGESIRLDWQTTLEVNSDRFEIMRSNDGQGDFVKIGELAAHGNSNAPRDYLWFDQYASAGQFFYRLDEYDANGTLSRSNIASVFDGEIHNELSIQMLPEQVSFSISTSEEKMELALIDLNGKMVYRANGIGAVLMEKAKFPAGIYLYQVKAGKDSFHGKIFLVD